MSRTGTPSLSRLVAVLAAGLLALSSCGFENSDREPTTGMATGPSAEQLQTAIDFSKWVDGLWYVFTFDDLPSGDYEVESVNSGSEDKSELVDPVRYPGVSDEAMSAVKNVNRARERSFKEYAARNFAAGERAAKRAAVRMEEARTAIEKNYQQVLAACGCILNESGDIVPVRSYDDYEEVEHWIDGDTVALVGGDRVRLIGIDTPEMTQDERCQTSGQDALENAEEMAPPGTMVRTWSPFSVNARDKYGRELRYVDVEFEDTGVTIDVGYSQILSGYAVARYDSRDGYQWHPREGDYRSASGEPDGPARVPPECLVASDEDQRSLSDYDTTGGDDGSRFDDTLRRLFLAEIRQAGKSRQRSEKAWREHDRVQREAVTVPGGSSGGGGGNYRYCRGRFCIG